MALTFDPGRLGCSPAKMLARHWRLGQAAVCAGTWARACPCPLSSCGQDGSICSCRFRGRRVKSVTGNGSEQGQAPHVLLAYVPRHCDEVTATRVTVCPLVWLIQFLPARLSTGPRRSPKRVPCGRPWGWPTWKVLYAWLLHGWRCMSPDAAGSLQAALSANCPHRPRSCAFGGVSPAHPLKGSQHPGCCGRLGPMEAGAAQLCPRGTPLRASLMNPLDTGLHLIACFPPGGRGPTTGDRREPGPTVVTRWNFPIRRRHRGVTVIPVSGWGMGWCCSEALGRCRKRT